MQPQPTVCITVDPDFLELALQEIRGIVAQFEIVAETEPGLLLLQGVEFFSLSSGWIEQPPLFIRHIAPIMAAYPLAGSRGEPAALQGTVIAKFEQLLDPQQSFSVQTRIEPDLPYKPFEFNKPISEALAAVTGAPIDVRNPTQVLSILIASISDESGHGTPTAFVGLSLAGQNLSSWAGGKRRFAREKGQVSRAEFKLLEALEVFAINLLPRGVALDLGAAPGGWTRVLRQREQYVTAIDPGALDPRIADDPRVRHLPVTAQAYLADEPERFDLIVNDMRMDARDSARLMVDYAGLLYAGGIGIMTLKLPETNRTPILHHAFNILRQGYEIAGARHLFHNRSEITAYIKRV